MRSRRHLFVLVLMATLLLAGKSFAAFGETIQFSDVFTLRDDGNNGTIDEIADTPPVVGVPSIWGSVDKRSRYDHQNLYRVWCPEYRSGLASGTEPDDQ